MNKAKSYFGLFKLFVYILILPCTGVSFFPNQSYAQSQSTKGLPFITNYRYQDYNADGINWWAAEGDKGLMYFANEKGILVYDGNEWELIKPTGLAETRCLIKGRDGKIYAGTNGDIGYLKPGKKGKLEFVSLKDKLPEKYRRFDEVWETGVYKGNIYFRLNSYLFLWDYKSFRVIESTEQLHVGKVVNDQFYQRVWNRGLTVLKEDSFHLVPNGEQFANERIYVMLPYDKERILIGTRTKGLFLYDGKDFTLFKTEADAFIFNTSLYGGLILSNGLIALNTFNHGMVIIDHQGKLVQRIDKSTGIQDNSTDHLFEDSRGLLWMSLFNGIAKLDLRSSLTFFDESKGLPAKTVFNVVEIDGTVYAATNNGVYMLNNSTNRFEFVTGTSGQIITIMKVGGDVLLGGAEKGLQKIRSGKAYPVIPGVNYDFHVTYFLRSRFDSTLFYFNLRSGMSVVKYNPVLGNYTIESFREDINGDFGESSETKNGNLWISGNNPGEMILLKPDRSSGKIDLANAIIETYNGKHGLPRKRILNFLYDGTTYFFSERDSIFVFNEKLNRFIQDTSLFLKNYMVNDADAGGDTRTDPLGRMWANFGSGVIVKIPTKDGSLKIIDAPFRELRKDYPVWAINPSVDKNGKSVVWFASREGVIRYDGNLDETSNGSYNTIIRGITLNDDSVFYSGFATPAEKPEFSHAWNSVLFQYAAPFFKQENEIVYSTYLEGQDKNWSEWNKQNFRGFGNLTAGKYTFRVKAKNIYDTESKEAVFSFSVLPPWYATWWAYMLYLIIATAVIYSIVRWRTHQLHAKHRELEKTVSERTAQLSHRVEELAVINSVQAELVREIDKLCLFI